MRHRNLAVLAPLAVSLVASGCATKKYVNTEIASAESRVETRVNQRVDDVESQVEANQVRLDEQERQLAELSRTSRDALDRALAAGKLAEGKFLYETVLSDDNVRFAVDRYEVSPEARTALAGIATRLKSENANVFIEVQGHTDSTGSEAYNLKLGEQRAAAVTRYLNLEQGIPLHRMSTISYGESAPVADNDTPEGRAKNRRVVLVVLK